MQFKLLQVRFRFGADCYKNDIKRLFLVGILVLIGGLFHPMGWGEERVLHLCGPDAEVFWPGDCRLGKVLHGILIANFECFRLMLKNGDVE